MLQTQCYALECTNLHCTPSSWSYSAVLVYCYKTENARDDIRVLGAGLGALCSLHVSAASRRWRLSTNLYPASLWSALFVITVKNPRFPPKKGVSVRSSSGCYGHIRVQFECIPRDSVSFSCRLLKSSEGEGQMHCASLQEEQEFVACQTYLRTPSSGILPAH